MFGRGLSKRAICHALGIVLFPSLCALAHAQANPYATIATRNVFRLRPPVVYKEPVPEPPSRPIPNLVLSGVVDFSNMKWALITRTDPGRPAVNCTLELGETEGGIELLEMNAQAATATVRVDGVDTLVLLLSSPTNQTTKLPAAPQISGFSRPPIPIRR